MTDIKKELDLDELEKVSGGARKLYTQYTLMAGDTIESVAAKAGTTKETIMRLNSISGTEKLSVGLSLKLPIK